MSNQYFSFYYSPIREGFDTSTWRTLFGLPIASGGKLLLNDTAIIHYGNIVRGDLTFSINVAAPGPGLSKKFGFFQPNKNSYAYFYINGNSFTAETSTGVTSTSTAITWQSAWTNTDTRFRVKWEAGQVSFYAGDVLQTTTCDSSITGLPMSIYIANESQDTLIFNYVDARSIQSYLMTEGQENAVFNEFYIYEASGITITESVTMLLKILNVNDLTGVSDSIILSESVTMLVFENRSVFDAMTLTESVTLLRF